VTEARASCVRLDKLKHILQNQDAEMSLGAADTSVRATSMSQVSNSAISSRRMNGLFSKIVYINGVADSSVRL
jgi:hypothetical protein